MYDAVRSVSMRGSGRIEGRKDFTVRAVGT